ncbi:MAG: hypothetical protein AB8H12_15745 [Lewinella sp.]
MSRSFSIALILLGSAILGSLMWLHFYLMENAHADTFQRMHHLNQLVIAQKTNSLEWQYQETREFFTSPNKDRFIKILQVWEKGDKARKEIVKLSFPQNWPTDKFTEYNSFEQYQILRKTMLKELRDVVSKIEIVYTENTKVFDFSKKLLEKRLEYIEDIYLEAEDKTHLRKIGPQINEVDFLTLTSLVCLEELLHSSSNFYTGCGPMIDEYFPVIVDGFATPLPGERINTRIAIGSFMANLDPQHVKLTVNGEPLKIGYDGIAPYSFIARGGKNEALKMKYSILNPFTGETREGESIYSY